MKDCNCGYCMGGEILAGFGIKICDLKVSQLILFKEQSHPGRVIVAYKDHVSELVNISDEERDLFFADVTRAARALHKAFSPKKVNYGAYGDTGCHLHVHLVPKYKDQYEWGGVFAMNPGEKFLSEEEYAEIVRQVDASSLQVEAFNGFFPADIALVGPAVDMERILDFHVRFERIHPFQDGNGRIGRLIMFKECLKYDIVPFIIEDNIKMFYYLLFQNTKYLTSPQIPFRLLF